jgi:hypothetical protein
VESLPGKEGSSEKRSKDWKEKEVKPQLKSSIFWEKKRKIGWNLEAAGRDSIKRKKERRSQFPIVQNLMCGLIRTHTSFAFPLPTIPWLFHSLPPFTIPFSINHDYLPHKLSRIFSLLQCTRCSIGTSSEWITRKKILAERKRVIGRMSDWVIKLEKRGGMVNHVITSTNLEVKWHCYSNLSTSYGSRHRHIHIAQAWVVCCVLYSLAVMALEFFLMSPGFNSFLFLRDEQNSKCVCVCGGGGGWPS